MTRDVALLAELNDLKDGPFYEFLKELRVNTVEGWTDAGDDRTAVLLQGEKRLLDRLINRIDSARSDYVAAREREARPNMSKSF